MRYAADTSPTGPTPAGSFSLACLNATAAQVFAFSDSGCAGPAGAGSAVLGGAGLCTPTSAGNSYSIACYAAPPRPDWPSQGNASSPAVFGFEQRSGASSGVCGVGPLQAGTYYKSSCARLSAGANGAFPCNATHWGVQTQSPANAGDLSCPAPALTNASTHGLVAAVCGTCIGPGAAPSPSPAPAVNGTGERARGRAQGARASGV